MQFLKDSFIALITETSTNLPPDVRVAMAKAGRLEQPGTQAAQALAIIASNVDMACEGQAPICQDTGMPTFFIRAPAGANQLEIRQAARQAIADATRQGKLRPNSVDSITGKNTGDNLGEGTPIFHFEQWEEEDIEVRLLLKGGGCENMNAQYSLPCQIEGLGRADRDLEGVRKCILHAVWKAQGQGCSPGVIGVCIGGDRAHGYALAKAQLLRTLDDVNTNTVLAGLEARILREAERIGVGPMGFGGRVSLIGCKITAANRLPACFFVSVAYDCWAFRRLGVILDAQSGAIKRWLYRDASIPEKPMAEGAGFQRTGKEIVLKSPVTEAAIRNLTVGDVVLLRGDMYTGRDAVHAHLMKNPAPVDLSGGLLYHCGPVVLKQNGGWKMTAAGPTTSIREEPYEAEVIKRFGIRAVIGKGGMGAKTLAALKDFGAVYLNAIGGAAQYYGRCIKSVKDVYFLEFGLPEAMWHLDVEDFPAIVTMDAHGNSLHADVERASAAILAKLADPVF
ncbi:MAG: fumarate hydratase [Bryobacteraceae bacterium]